jgi:hypothetical protein
VRQIWATAILATGAGTVALMLTMVGAISARMRAEMP